MQHNEQASPTPVAGVDVAAIRAWLYDHAATCVIDDGDGDCRHTLPNCESEWCRGCIYVATIAALDALTRAQAIDQMTLEIQREEAVEARRVIMDRDIEIVQLKRAQAEQRELIADAARALLCGPVDPELTAAEYLRQALREVPAKWKERALLIEERDALKAAQAEQQGEIAAFKAAVERANASFKRRHPETGKCECLYCTQDFEHIAEYAANMELDLFSAQQQRDALKAEVARLTQALQQAQPSPVAEQGQE